MQNVLTLIGAEGRPLRDADLAAAREALRGVGAETGSPAILAPERAVDLPFDGASPEAVQSAARALLSDIDLVAQPAAYRRKRLLVADMDSTIIQVECIDELADFAGLKPQIAAITERAMRGELEFESALRERVGLLKGLPVQVLEQTFAERVRLTPGARALVGTMRTHGAHAALVSGGFTFFTERVAAQVGFHHHWGNTLLVEDGTLSGQVGDPILGRDAKLASLIRLRGELGLLREEVLAIGDGANDLAMLQEAGLGIAYHAKPVVAEAAHARIDRADLTALLYVQGYRSDEIASDDFAP
jgi:phosphoserine phosphatase